MSGIPQGRTFLGSEKFARVGGSAERATYEAPELLPGDGRKRNVFNVELPSDDGDESDMKEFVQLKKEFLVEDIPKHKPQPKPALSGRNILNRGTIKGAEDFDGDSTQEGEEEEDPFAEWISPKNKKKGEKNEELFAFHLPLEGDAAWPEILKPLVGNFPGSVALDSMSTQETFLEYFEDTLVRNFKHKDVLEALSVFYTNVAQKLASPDYNQAASPFWREGIHATRAELGDKPISRRKARGLLKIMHYWIWTALVGQRQVISSKQGNALDLLIKCFLEVVKKASMPLKVPTLGSIYKQPGPGVLIHPAHDPERDKDEYEHRTVNLANPTNDGEVLKSVNRNFSRELIFNTSRAPEEDKRGEFSAGERAKLEQAYGKKLFSLHDQSKTEKEKFSLFSRADKENVASSLPLEGVEERIPRDIEEIIKGETSTHLRNLSDFGLNSNVTLTDAQVYLQSVLGELSDYPKNVPGEPQENSGEFRDNSGEVGGISKKKSDDIDSFLTVHRMLKSAPKPMDWKVREKKSKLHKELLRIKKAIQNTTLSMASNVKKQDFESAAANKRELNSFKMKAATLATELSKLQKIAVPTPPPKPPPVGTNIRPEISFEEIDKMTPLQIAHLGMQKDAEDEERKMKESFEKTRAKDEIGDKELKSLQTHIPQEPVKRPLGRVYSMGDETRIKPTPSPIKPHSKPNPSPNPNPNPNPAPSSHPTAKLPEDTKNLSERIEEELGGGGGERDFELGVEPPSSKKDYNGKFGKLGGDDKRERDLRIRKALKRGMRVMYNSPSAGKYVDAIVRAVHRDGRVDLNIRANADPKRIKVLESFQRDAGERRRSASMHIDMA
ncbi:hypothetical protein AAMO2058_000081300 [Amorphochlora amoebiformis]